MGPGQGHAGTTHLHPGEVAKLGQSGPSHTPEAGWKEAEKVQAAPCVVPVPPCSKSPPVPCAAEVSPYLPSRPWLAVTTLWGCTAKPRVHLSAQHRAVLVLNDAFLSLKLHSSPGLLAVLGGSSTEQQEGTCVRFGVCAQELLLGQSSVQPPLAPGREAGGRVCAQGLHYSPTSPWGGR